MSLTLKSIKLIYIFILYFSFFNLSATENSSENNSIQQGSSSSDLKRHLESKRNNFKDRLPTERILLIYTNSILDNLLSNNKEILDRFGRSKDEFFIDINTNIFEADSSFTSFGNGEITFNISGVHLLLEKGYIRHESYITAIIAHELAHDLLNHGKKVNEFKNTLYEKYFTEIQKNTEENIKNNNYEVSGMDPFLTSIIVETMWIDFLDTQPDLLKLHQQHEIEADNLGLQLYLNTRFKAIDFGNQFIKEKYSYNNSELYPSIPDIFRKLSEKNYISEGIQARKEGRFNEFMNSIKYEKPTNIHPSEFWRYWNARDQIEANNIDSDHGIQDNLYFKIDVSRSDRLKEIEDLFTNSKIFAERAFFPHYYHKHTRDINILLKNFSKIEEKLSEKENEFFNSILGEPITYTISKEKTQNKSTETSAPSTNKIKKIKNTMIYIIDELLNPDSQISFSIESSKDTDKVEKLGYKDNFLTIRAHDLYRIMTTLQMLNNINDEYCVDLFSSEKDTKDNIKELKEELDFYISDLLSFK